MSRQSAGGFKCLLSWIYRPCYIEPNKSWQLVRSWFTNSGFVLRRFIQGIGVPGLSSQQVLLRPVFPSLSALLTFPVELVFQPYCGAIDWLIHLTGIKGSLSSLPMLSHSCLNGSRMRPRLHLYACKSFIGLGSHCSSAKLLIPLLLRFQGIERNGVEFFLSWKHNSVEVKPCSTRNQESMRGRIRRRSSFFWNEQTERFRCALERKKSFFFYFIFFIQKQWRGGHDSCGS